MSQKVLSASVAVWSTVQVIRAKGHSCVRSYPLRQATQREAQLRHGVPHLRHDVYFHA